MDKDGRLIVEEGIAGGKSARKMAKEAGVSPSAVIREARSNRTVSERGSRQGANLEPCQYNGQRNRRFLHGQHVFRTVPEGPLEALEELLHGLCRHAVPDGLVRTAAAAIWLDGPDRPVLRRGCIRRALVAVPLVPGRPEERL